MLHHVDESLSNNILEGFTFGFNIGFQGIPHNKIVKNLKSVFEHPDLVQQKVNEEVLLGRIKGPFDLPPFENIVLSPIGIIPKKNAREV